MQLVAGYESSDDEAVVPAAPVAQLPNAPADSSTPSVVEQGPPATVTAPPADVAPASPYASTRAAIQSLTLPTVPNFDIPPSPPGSPPQQSTKKFAQFLELKNKGQHFNQRLEGSTVLRDPAHLQRLLEFAGIRGDDQYALTLPEGVAVPTSFPEGAYMEELSASQKKIRKAQEEANARNPRESIDFVPATTPATSSGHGTPSARVGRQSGAERIMAVGQQSQGKRTELEQRGRRDDGLVNKKRRRSRSGGGR